MTLTLQRRIGSLQYEIFLKVSDAAALETVKQNIDNWDDQALAECILPGYGTVFEFELEK